MDEILVESGTEITTVTLNNPRRRNAITLAMWHALAALFDGLETTAGLRAVILQGAGGNFSAGADIQEFGRTRSTPEQCSDYETAVDRCCDAIARLSKPTFAVLTGYCLGGGCHLAMACDFRFAAADAVLGIPAARISIVYGVKGTARLRALVGPAHAKWILFSGERFPAADAHGMGLVDRIEADPAMAARQRAQTLAANAPLSLAGAKYILNALDAPQGVDAERAGQMIRRAVDSADYREGRRAFLERRPPAFLGK